MTRPSSLCLNHPEREAVARCKQCHKPLCQRCALAKSGGVFCSEECFEKMGAFQQRVETLDLRRKPGFSFGKLVKQAVILAIVGGVIYYVFVVAEVRSVDELVNMVKGFMP